jgi:SAM-dependent methyltransferase
MNSTTSYGIRIEAVSSSLADRWTFCDGLIQRLRYRQVAVHIPQGCILADLGCGNGDFLKYLEGRAAFGYGIDTAIDSTLNNDRLSFKSGNLNERIPLDDESVDVVTSLAVIEHLWKPDVFLEEILRILKPGGYCLMTTPSPYAKPILEFLAYKLKIISEKDIRDHKNYFNKTQLASLFSNFKTANIDYFQCGLNTAVFAIK